VHFRRTMHGQARRYARWALVALEKAMKVAPGPYPDPDCPIGKWQHAHEHLSCALELLK
jgi:hypothetical protein